MAATLTRFVLNAGGLRELFTGDEMQDSMGDYGENVAEHARENGPVDTGAYVDSIEVVVVVEGDVAVVKVGATVDYAIYVEAETGNLVSALDAADR